MLLSSHSGWTADKQKPAGLQAEAAEHLWGPYIISGGWWKRLLHREYYFAAIHSGDLQWVYFDQVRKRWFLQGKVE